jgi:hypothetical protein
MGVLWRFRLFGVAIGVALTRLIVLFSVLIGPIYFAQAVIPAPSPLFEWLHSHTILPLAVSPLALLLLRLASLVARKFAASRPSWLRYSCELVLVIGIVLQLCAVQRNLYADAFPYVDDVNEPFRKPLETQLSELPGQHLILVRYSKDHNSGEEYVYNEADIDHAKIVWAREIPGAEFSPLLNYFRNRDVWVFEPDSDDATVSPYEQNDK